jgi:hypothetical protein
MKGGQYHGLSGSHCRRGNRIALVSEKSVSASGQAAAKRINMRLAAAPLPGNCGQAPKGAAGEACKHLFSGQYASGRQKVRFLRLKAAKCGRSPQAALSRAVRIGAPKGAVFTAESRKMRTKPASSSFPGSTHPGAKRRGFYG